MIYKNKKDTSVFDNLISLDEAGEYWELHSSTIRKAIAKEKFELAEELYKFGKTWVITIEGMKRVYGEPKVDFENRKKVLVKNGQVLLK